MHRAIVPALLAASTVLLASTEARAWDESSAAVQANKGLHLGFGPVILFPTDQGPFGGGLDFDLRYGIAEDPVIIGPGGRLAGYLISGRFIGIAMPTLRLTLPLGPLAPYLLTGVGGGWLSNPGEANLAVMAGGGMMIHFGKILGVGVEATYQTILDTEFKETAIGPMIHIGL